MRDANLNIWLKQTAKQHKEKGVSSTFVTVPNGQGRNPRFLCHQLTKLVNANLPAQHGKRLPTRVPVFRLGRLATAIGHQGKTYWEFMLFDAIAIRTTRIADEIGGGGLVVNAKPAAVDFYRRLRF